MKMEFFGRQEEIAALRRIDLDALRTKAEAFFAKNPEKKGYDRSFGGLSLGDL